MNKRILLTSVAILCLGNISESRAECANNQTCGDDCCWSIDNGTLNITGSGKMDGYAVSTDQPWNSQKDIITAINVSGVDNIGYRAFQFLDKVNNVILSDSVKEVEHRAFWGNTSLTSISMPNVTSIGDYAFYYASSLTSITIPEGVTSIGDYAFTYTGLTSITIPDSVTSIGDAVFFNVTGLTNIMCKGDETSCADTVNALRAKGYTGNISYPTDKTSCEGADVSLFVWDSENEKCGRRNEEQCNSVAKYYYNSSANNGAGQCQLLPKKQSACTGANIEWNATDKKCVNKNYTTSQESSEFSEADCYNNGQVPYNNQCWDEYPFARKRWTPAEASKWLHDGNDNFVVITFKK